MPTFLNTRAIVNRRELLSTFFNDDTIGRSIENKDWLFLTMSMSLVLKIFILEKPVSKFFCISGDVLDKNDEHVYQKFLVNVAN